MADLLRASVAKSGNEHRLGAHEAPPAIISIFLGDLLDEIIEQIEKGGTKKARTQKTINIGVDTCPCSLWTPPTGTAPAPLPSQAINSNSAP